MDKRKNTDSNDCYLTKYPKIMETKNADDKPKKIYFAYCEEDDETAYKIVCEIEGHSNFVCYFKDRDEVNGIEGIGIALDQECKSIQSSHFHIFLYTKSSLKKNLVTFLQINSLQDSLASNQMKLIFLLHGIHKDDLPPEVKFVPYVRTIDDLIKRLKEPTVCLDHLLPLGNISFGLLWNYYYGFLKLILPEIGNTIDKWVNEDPSNRSCTSRSFFIILPTDDEFPKCLSESDNCIEHVGPITTHMTSRAGTPGREYHNSIYKIRKDKKDYFFIGEYAGPLDVMSMIKQGELTGLKELDLQKKCFKEKLSGIIKGQKHCSLIIWDKKKSLSDVIIEHIRNENLESPISDGATLSLEESGEDQKEIFIAYCDEDFEFADGIVEKIEKNRRLQCYFSARDALQGSIFKVLFEKSYSCHSILFICSKDFLECGQATYHICTALHQAAEEKNSGKLNLVFLFRNSVEIPQQWQNLPHVSEKADDYVERLMEKLEAPKVFVDNLIPVGNIYSGLAWSYYYNYLDLILPEVSKKIDNWSRENPDESGYIPRRLYILLPTNAKCYKSVCDADSVSIERKDSFISLEVPKVAGKPRKYQTTIYQINKPDKKYCIAAEYATPLTSMDEMAREQISGLTDSDLMRQTKLFIQKLQEIFSHKDVIKKYSDCFDLVIVDDNKEKLSDLLVKKIEEDKEKTELFEKCSGIGIGVKGHC